MARRVVGRVACAVLLVGCAVLLVGCAVLLVGCADRTLTPWAPTPEVYERDGAVLRALAEQAPFRWKPAQDAPDIVVIVLDTVRADRLGLYGYGGGTTPNLDRWSAGARVYTRAWASSPWTLPSHASLFTGLPPRSHGAHGTREGDTLTFAAPLPADVPTVAEALRRRGYATAGIAANQAYLDARWGLARGFDLWLCEELEAETYPTADRITALARAWLSRPARGGRFLFLNYLDAHAPWHPWSEHVADPEVIDRRYLPYRGGRWSSASDDLLAGEGAPPEALAAWSEAYDAELRFLDHHVGRLLDELPRLGVGPGDYVFILSDHGEQLGEHDLVLHGRDVYEGSLSVPLLVAGQPPGRDDRPVQHHDVARMILEAAGLPPLAGSPVTTDLQVAEHRYARGRDLRDRRYGERFRRQRLAFRLGDWKLIEGTDGSVELYDLARDPGETSPAVSPDDLARLQAAADHWRARTPERTVVSSAVDEAALERLKALGYAD